MYHDYVAQILSKYGIDFTEILEPQKGYRNVIYPIRKSDDELIQLTFFKDEPGITERIARADHVSAYLAEHGFPARRRLDDRTITLRSTSRTIYAGLYNYLPGDTISWDAYTRRHLVLLGKTLSDIHATLIGVAFDSLSVEDELTQLVERMQHYFTNQHIMDAVQKKLGLRADIDFPYFQQVLDGTRHLPGRQSLHMDFVRSNVLFAPAQPSDQCTFGQLAIAGILDFEKTAYGHPLYDAARTLAFLLVDCQYKSEAEVTKYFLHSGYQKRGQASLPHSGKLLDLLVSLFLVHDFYKFLRHNPYESLSQNEHYIRTRDILYNRGMLHYI